MTAWSHNSDIFKTQLMWSEAGERSKRALVEQDNGHSDYDVGIQAANEWLEMESTSYKQIKSLCERFHSFIHDVNDHSANTMATLVLFSNGWSGLVNQYGTKGYTHTHNTRDMQNDSRQEQTKSINRSNQIILLLLLLLSEAGIPKRLPVFIGF